MWFDRARFGHLDDDAYEALHNYPHASTDGKAQQPFDEQTTHPAPAKSSKAEKSGTDAILKLSDFTHLNKTRKPGHMTPSIQPIEHPHDGRWVLAVRTAESIRHGQLDPQKRVRLMKLGKLLGLTPMDANRIISIIIDHADRGIAPDQLTRQSFAQLEQSAPPPLRHVSRINWFTVGLTTLLMMLLEFATLFAWFRK